VSSLRRPTVLAFIALVIAAACSASSTAPSPSPTAGPALNQSELRFRLIDTFGPLWYCDRDFYPIAVADEADLAVKRFGEIQADREAFAAVSAKLGVSGPDYTADQKLAIYRLWKMLNAIVLDPAPGGAFRFDYLNQPAGGATEGRRTTGTIGPTGSITIDQQTAAGAPPCPICLARGTRIATPTGDVAVEDVRVGMRIWSVDSAGGRVAATVLEVGSTTVPSTHQVVRLVLSDGRVLRASPGHPLADGRRLGSIRAGDVVDGSTVLSARLEPYHDARTFDLLPDGPTGVYFADKIPLGSTLAAR